ncbi:CRISPR-associated DxTHG motif protein [Collinsella sp. AM34-10]|nr:CRISPR-associated DxTHG motif protein [Collinsella sp. OM08-14AT]RHC92613.1 CRISPR-associated DxTHG motif protein [Collinsella sp. AM34-10]
MLTASIAHGINYIELFTK